MRIDAGAQNGTSQSKTKRIYEITARLYESIGIEIGPDLDNMGAKNRFPVGGAFCVLGLLCVRRCS